MKHLTIPSGTLDGPIAALHRDATTRRAFLRRVAIGGAGAGAAMSLAHGLPAMARQDFDPGPLEDLSGGDRETMLEALKQGVDPTRPSHGTEGQERGAGGELMILIGQAPYGLLLDIGSSHGAGIATAMTQEPLMHYLSDGTIIPNLVREVPSVDNGLLAEDLTSVTYRLLPDVTWSDGEPFTADDVRFTWEWHMNPESESWGAQLASTIDDVEVDDDLTVTIRFANPNPTWFSMHTGTWDGLTYPRHILGEGGAETRDAFAANPIGTGPFTVESFTSGKFVEYAVNERYREPNKPYFSSVVIEHYGDSMGATRDFFEKGTHDFSWRLTGDVTKVAALADESDLADLVMTPWSYTMHALNINFSDPRTEVDDQISEMNTPHPFLTERAVREAMALAIDRDAIAMAVSVGPELDPPPTSMLDSFPAMTSSVPAPTYDPERAKKVLDDAGWIDSGDGIRVKDGVRLEVDHRNVTTFPFQGIHDIVIANLRAVGFGVNELLTEFQVFWDHSPGNNLAENRFYTDLQMLWSIPDFPFPLEVLRQWYAGPGRENIPQKSNDWLGSNVSRYNNPDYDALFEHALTETDRDTLIDLCHQMNDIISQDHVAIPLVCRRETTGCIKTLNKANLDLGPFSHATWNIANWNRVIE